MVITTRTKPNMIVFAFERSSCSTDARSSDPIRSIPLVYQIEPDIDPLGALVHSLLVLSDARTDPLESLVHAVEGAATEAFASCTPRCTTSRRAIRRAPMATRPASPN